MFVPCVNRYAINEEKIRDVIAFNIEFLNLKELDSSF
jgi:hypothetical protein